jgi:multisubunit Na+/H+ antiporter MnhF subunit
VHKSRVAAAVVGLEGVACIVAGIGFVVAAIVGHPHDRATAIVLGVYGVGVVLVGRGLDRGRSWARTPAFLVQFFALVVAWYQRDTLPAITAVLAVVALAAIVALARAQTEHRT